MRDISVEQDAQGSTTAGREADQLRRRSEAGRLRQSGVGVLHAEPDRNPAQSGPQQGHLQEFGSDRGRMFQSAFFEFLLFQVH